MYYTTGSAIRLYTTKIPGGVVGSLSAVTLPVLNVKLGRKVSGDPPQLPTEFVAFDKKEILLYNKTITFFSATAETTKENCYEYINQKPSHVPFTAGLYPGICRVRRWSGQCLKFPYICGENGGGAFLIIYLLCLLLLGLPIVICEFAIGRGSRRSISQALNILEQPGSRWHITKYAGIAGNYLLMMFYTMVAGDALLCVPVRVGKDHGGFCRRDLRLFLPDAG